MTGRTEIVPGLTLRELLRWWLFSGALGLILFVGLGLASTTEDRQLFLDVGGDESAGYPIHGIRADVLCDVHGDYRRTIGNEIGPGGWGEILPAWVEVYVAGVRVDWFDVDCMNYDCCPATGADLNGDGEVNLLDYAEFQRAFGG